MTTREKLIAEGIIRPDVFYVRAPAIDCPVLTLLPGEQERFEAGARARRRATGEGE